MRSAQEMQELIIDTARNDERIRAVILNGSRANPAAMPDIFQDFDIVYVVSDPTSFRQNPAWIKRFGRLMIMQQPDEMQNAPVRKSGAFSYLMQFSDGNRLDLTLFPLENLDELDRDSLSLLLLDKDGFIAPFPPPGESDYLPTPPSAREFADCCNEFWWVCPYVAKGLWRTELIYARQLLDQVLRAQLMKMLTWQVGIKNHFSTNPGKFGTKLNRQLDPEQWEMLQMTYANADEENNWEALQMMCALFRTGALFVAGHCGFAYPHEDDEQVSAHLQHVRLLPRDAKEMY